MTTKPSFDDVAPSVAGRFRRGAHYYARSKFRIDPVARALFELAEREPLGDVVDVGCGRGQFALLLLEAGLASSVFGVDWDASKVAIATAAAGDLPARFVGGDVREASLPSADSVLLIDVLHYLAPAAQDELLVRASQAARRRIVIRDVDPGRGATSTLTRSWEWVTTSLGYNRGERVMPRSFDEMEAILVEQGFDVTRELCSARGLSNVLMVGRR